MDTVIETIIIGLIPLMIGVSIILIIRNTFSPTGEKSEEEEEEEPKTFSTLFTRIFKIIGYIIASLIILGGIIWILYLLFGPPFHL